MSRKQFRYLDGTTETWDDATGFYVRNDPDGAELEKRTLTGDECSMLDPRATEIRTLQDVVDQLILDALMGGL